MRGINFLKKNKKEKKLASVEPSENISKAYLTKSNSNLKASKLLLKNDQVEKSIYLSYYSMYNLPLSLLFRVGFKSENHSASIILLNLVFGLDSSKLLFAKKERVDKQYYVDFKLSKDDVGKMIEIAEDFNGVLKDFISRLNKGQIDIYRIKFGELLSDGKKAEC